VLRSDSSGGSRSTNPLAIESGGMSVYTLNRSAEFRRSDTVDSPSSPFSRRVNLMSHETNPASPATAPPAKSGSAIRLLILLGLLAVAISMWWYDYSVAGPGSETAYLDIEALVKQRNEQGVSSGKKADLVRSEDIQALLKMKPTKTEVNPDHTIEYYCWWGSLPWLNTYKRYITVVYVGDERRFSTHHKNERPPLESLPGYVPPSEDKGKVFLPAAGTPSSEVSGEGGNGGKGKGKGKGSKGADSPMTDTSSEGDAALPGADKSTEEVKPVESQAPPSDSEEPTEEAEPAAKNQPAEETAKEDSPAKPADE